jgi:hypothetical protein
MPVPHDSTLRGPFESSLFPGRAILRTRRTWARPKCFICSRRVEVRDEVRLCGLPVHLECSYYAPGAAGQLSSLSRLESERARSVDPLATPGRLAA